MAEVAWLPRGPRSEWPRLGSRALIIRLIIQTIRRDPSGADQIDEAPNVSRPDPTGADQIDAEHQSTDLAVGGSNPSRRAERPGHTPIGGLTARLAEAAVNDLPDSRLRRGYTPLATYPGPSNQRNRQRRPACQSACRLPRTAQGRLRCQLYPSQPIRPAAGFSSCSTCSGWAMTRHPPAGGPLGGVVRPRRAGSCSPVGTLAIGWGQA